MKAGALYNVQPMRTMRKLFVYRLIKLLLVCSIEISSQECVIILTSAFLCVIIIMSHMAHYNYGCGAYEKEKRTSL